MSEKTVRIECPCGGAKLYGLQSALQAQSWTHIWCSVCGKKLWENTGAKHLAARLDKIEEQLQNLTERDEELRCEATGIRDRVKRLEDMLPSAPIGEFKPPADALGVGKQVPCNYTCIFRHPEGYCQCHAIVKPPADPLGVGKWAVTPDGDVGPIETPPDPHLIADSERYVGGLIYPVERLTPIDPATCVLRPNVDQISVTYHCVDKDATRTVVDVGDGCVAFRVEQTGCRVRWSSDERSRVRLVWRDPKHLEK